MSRSFNLFLGLQYQPAREDAWPPCSHEGISVPPQGLAHSRCLIHIYVMNAGSRVGRQFWMISSVLSLVLFQVSKGRYFIIFKCKKTFLKSDNTYSSIRPHRRNTLWGCSFPKSPPLAVNTAKESSGQNCCLGKNDAFSWKVSLKGSDLGSALRSTWSSFPVWKGFFITIRKQREDSSGRIPKETSWAGMSGSGSWRKS